MARPRTRSYSISRATRSAISRAGLNRSTRCSARSSPEVTPPAVTMSPSSTNARVDDLGARGAQVLDREVVGGRAGGRR